MTENYSNTKKRKPNNQLFLKVFLPVFIVLLLIFTGCYFFMFQEDGENKLDDTIEELLISGELWDNIKVFAGGDSEFAQTYAEVHRVNVLLLGHNNQLTDTIMLASFDTDLKRVDIISVPRDTYFERPNFPGAAYQKINSVYETEGIEGIAEAVSKVLAGVPVHYYMIITDDGVAKIVDSMGGVEFDVPMDMKYDDPEQGLFIDLKQGLQLLDGDHAVQYLRYRKGYPTADLGRIQAQQSFMKEAFKQSLGKDLPKVIRTVTEEVETNLNATLAVRIAGEAVGMGQGSIETYTAPGKPEMRNSASYVIVNEAAAIELMHELYSMQPPAVTGAAISGAAVEGSESVEE